MDEYSVFSRGVEIRDQLKFRHGVMNKLVGEASTRFCRKFFTRRFSLTFMEALIQSRWLFVYAYFFILCCEVVCRGAIPRLRNPSLILSALFLPWLNFNGVMFPLILLGQGTNCACKFAPYCSCFLSYMLARLLSIGDGVGQHMRAHPP